MRVAICGTHRVGKTTLAEALAEALPGHELVPEPYWQLEEEGHTFADEPSLEDFELQLERSLACLEQGAAAAVFDRSPLDLLGYILTHEDADAFELDAWLTRIREQLATLDLLVFVPIEEPERIAVPRSEARLRTKVDAALRELVLDDSYGLELEALEVTGTPAARLRAVLAQLAKDKGRS